MPNTATYTTYAGHASATVTVTNQAELNAALSSMTSNSGGTILLDGNGGPYDVSIGNYNGTTGGAGKEVLIKGVDANNPPVIKQVALINTSHVTIDGVKIDSSDGHNPTHGYDLYVTNSSNIEVTNSTLVSDANGYVSESGSATVGNNMALFSNSSNINFSGNDVSNYFHGIVSLEVKGLTIDGNHMTGIQGDGIRNGGVQDVKITNNHLHDFYGSTQSINHSDMIQFWGTNATLLTQNVEIAGNILDSGNGPATQSIFMRNENYGANEASGGHFQNISVHDNVIHNGHWHGISINDATGIDISDNTVLWNAKSGMQASDGAALDYGKPWVMVSNSPNYTIQDNLSWRVYVDNNYQWGEQNPGNYILDFDNPGAANYVGNHIVNWAGYQGPSDLMLQSSSALHGVMGAAQSSGGTPSSGSGGSNGDNNGGGSDPVDTGGDGNTGDNTTPPTDTGGDGNTDTGGSSGDQQGSGDDGGQTGGSGQTDGGGQADTGGQTGGGSDDQEPVDGGGAVSTPSDPVPEKPVAAVQAPQDDDDDDGGFFLAKLFKAIMQIFISLFGGGKSSHAHEAQEQENNHPGSREAEVENVSLHDLVPSTGSLDENMPQYEDDGDDEDAMDLAA